MENMVKMSVLTTSIKNCTGIKAMQRAKKNKYKAYIFTKGVKLFLFAALCLYRKSQGEATRTIKGVK